MAVKFSVVIPSRDRVETLEHTVATVLSQDYPNFELIISDNQSTDGTRAMIEGLNDPRVRYLHTGSRLGMSENFDFALKYVEGDWVAFLGNDDGLLPGALKRASSLVERSGCEALCSPVVSYFWPNGRTSNPSPELGVPIGTGSYFERKVPQLRTKVLRGERHFTELPSLYTGSFIAYPLIRRALVDGKMFHSQAPDIYSSLALAGHLDRFLVSRRPLALAGSSRKSTGLSVFGESGDDAGRQQYHSEGQLRVHPWVGESGTIVYSMVLYDSWLRLAEVTGQSPSTSPEFHYALALNWARNFTSREVRVALQAHLQQLCRQHGFSVQKLWMNLPLTFVQLQRYRLHMARKAASMRWLPGAYGARDVYAASLVANAVLEERLLPGPWRLRQLVERLSHRFSKGG